jgi:hypothetical protein
MLPIGSVGIGIVYRPGEEIVIRPRRNRCPRASGYELAGILRTVMGKGPDSNNRKILARRWHRLPLRPDA